MNKMFADYIAALPLLTDRLRASKPLTAEQIARLRSSGVYSFSEDGRVLYIGRTRNFRDRHKSHCHEKSGENKAAFAFRLARASSGRLKPSYKKEGSRKDLMEDPDFVQAFSAAKKQIEKMEVRFIEVLDPIQQHLLELYASLEFASSHNNFETT